MRCRVQGKRYKGENRKQNTEYRSQNSGDRRKDKGERANRLEVAVESSHSVMILVQKTP
jgi:hypothetical protein